MSPIDRLLNGLLRMVSQLGAPTVLVNAAGVSAHATVDQLDDDEWQSVLDINLTGCMRMIRACWPTMHAEQFGRIVNIGSTAARTGAVGYSAFAHLKQDCWGLRVAPQSKAPPQYHLRNGESDLGGNRDVASGAAEIATRTGRSVVSEIQAIAESSQQRVWYNRRRRA